MTMVTNGTTPNKRELSWDDFATGNFPPSRFQHAVTQAATSLSENNAIPMAPGKVEKAMDLVLTGAVRTIGEGTYTVKSGAHTYQIAGECTCQDSQHRSRYCKHYLAVMIWKKAQAIMQPAAANGNGRDPDPGDGKMATPIPHDHLVAQPAPLPIVPDCADTHHWTDQQPPIVWHLEFMVDGISHGVTVRCDDLVEARTQVKEITAMVKKAHVDETPAPQAGCPKHGTAKLKPSTKHGGMYCAAKDGDKWCTYKGEA